MTQRSLPPIINQALLRQALTHRSYAHEYPEQGGHNERLEFLGDAVLGFVIGDWLFQRFPGLSEADLSYLRSRLVDETQLASLARELCLGEQIRLGRGAEKDGGRDSPAILSDTLEALLGACYQDVGLESVRAYIHALYDDLEILQAEINPTALPDAKNRLQQWANQQFNCHPHYQIIDQQGPPHERQFTAEVSIEGTVYGRGTGRRKQEAEKRAALVALAVIEVNST
ncbi:MAG: ribonuclease III [Cyanobacteria bacterium P01_H01_bin.15]